MSEIALIMKPLVEQQAKGRKAEGHTKRGKKDLVEKLPQDNDRAPATRDIVGKLAGVSGKTIEKVRKYFLKIKSLPPQRGHIAGKLANLKQGRPSETLQICNITPDGKVALCPTLDKAIDEPKIDTLVPSWQLIRILTSCQKEIGLYNIRQPAQLVFFRFCFGAERAAVRSRSRAQVEVGTPAAMAAVSSSVRSASVNRTLNGRFVFASSDSGLRPMTFSLTYGLFYSYGIDRPDLIAMISQESKPINTVNLKGTP